MKIINGLFFFILLLTAFISVVSSPGCANIIPPSGGPKDTLPPVLVSVVPRDSTLRFNTNRIVFTFDEYVEVKDKEKYIIINPMPKSTPTIDYKLKVVTVKIRDTLQPNTTYSINFGKAIRDVNEGNALKDFTYVFSTGSYLDSLEFSGRVIVAVTGKADSTLIVMLHRNPIDSAVINERPRYVTTVDTTGAFTFHNLAPGTYSVYALKDEGGARRYSSKSQLFAFADSPVVIKQGYVPRVSLYAYAEEVEKLPAPKTKTNTSSTPPPSKKTLQKEKNKRLQVQVNIAGNEFDILDTLQIKFPTPIRNFDSTKFRFTDDQYKDIPASKYRLLKDSINSKFTILYIWLPDTKYHIIADKEFAEDTMGRKLLKNDTISFHTKRESEYGEVRLRFKNLDLSKNPVLQFVDGDVVKYSYAFKSREFYKKLFQPGEYELRILYDDNKNGIWDPGTFFGKRKQPEKVVPIKINKPRHKLTVRANWDNDIDFTL
jgi:hypothetical protein